MHSMMNEKGKLWVQVLTEKYCRTDFILTEQVRLGNSYVWRGILKARDAVQHGFGVKLGDGQSSLWYSNWLGTGKLACKVPFVHVTDTNLVVADLWQHGTWHFDRLYTILPEEMREDIENITVPAQPSGVDRVLWKEEDSGIYSARSAYRLLTDDDGQESRFWKMIWKASAPEKVRFFLWLAGRNALPSNARRHHKHLAISAACVRCGAVSEDADHVLRQCPRSVWMWSQFARLLAKVPVAAPLRFWLYTHLQVQDNALFCAVIWNVWKWRNSFAFDHTPWT